MNSTTADRTVVGAGVGLGVGTLVSVTSAGCIPCGAAVGTAVGAGVGLAYDQYNKSQYGR
jgi:glucokinase